MMKFNLVNYMEEKAVNEALMKGTIPTPSGDNWKAIQKKYNLPDPIKVDSVQSEVKLPPGWTFKVNKRDVRHMTIMDHEGKKVGSVFLKQTPYDYYGSVNFDTDRLKELGIDNKSDDSDNSDDSSLLLLSESSGSGNNDDSDNSNDDSNDSNNSNNDDSDNSEHDLTPEEKEFSNRIASIMHLPTYLAGVYGVRASCIGEREKPKLVSAYKNLSEEMQRERKSIYDRCIDICDEIISRKHRQSNPQDEMIGAFGAMASNGNCFIQ